MDKKFKICEFAYTRVEICGLSGMVTCCCPAYTNEYSLGNIKEESFKNIWNGVKIRRLRQSMLDGNFKYCNRNLCIPPMIEIDEDTTIADYPKNVEIAVSTMCNVCCVMCRDKLGGFLHPAEREDGFFDKMLPKYLEALKYAETLGLNSYGEALCDPNCKKLLVEALKINPKLKIYLLTNGILCDEKHLKEFGIYKNIHTISVSIHAATKEVYDRVVRYGNFEKAKRNIEWIVNQKKRGIFKRIILNFVVSDYNYKDMINFAQWAKSLGEDTEAHFWEFRKDSDISFIHEYDKHAVFLPEHPEYENLVEILKNPIFKEKFCWVNDLLLNLKSNK